MAGEVLFAVVGDLADVVVLPANRQLRDIRHHAPTHPHRARRAPLRHPGALLSCLDFDGTQECVARKRMRAAEGSRGEDWRREYLLCIVAGSRADEAATTWRRATNREAFQGCCTTR